MRFLDKHIASQLERPHGIAGRTFGKIMRKVNSSHNAFVKENLFIQQDDHVLEVGFGDGSLLHEICLNAPKGSVSGIDISKTMVNLARKNNLTHIRSGLLDLRLASVESIPYQAETFNKVCSNNTIYFWPDPEKALNELWRVTSKGGVLALGLRTKEALESLPYTQYRFQLYTLEQVAMWLSCVGFTNVTIIKKSQDSGLACITAVKI